MFVGREYELETLQRLYMSKKFEFLVLYGRRRIGKTTLLTHFARDKKVIFYSAQESHSKLNLDMFSQCVYDFFSFPKATPRFENWNQLFAFLGEQAEHQDFMLIIDEFPYLANCDNSILSILQHQIDHHWKDTKLKFIISGSSMGFMEKEVLSEKSPLFGRRSSQMKLEELTIFDMKKMLSKCSPLDVFRYYAAIGGTPYYVSLIDEDEDYIYNMNALFYRTTSYLYGEPLYLLRQELREPSLYNSIIKAIASGKTKMNEIANEVGEKTSTLSQYLNNLIQLDIVEREYPIFENPLKSKKSIYKLKDQMFCYWYKYIFGNQLMIEMHQGMYVLGENEKQIHEFYGYVFEKICYQFLIENNGKQRLPFIFTNIGRWWGKNASGAEDEIDIVAANKESALICECKFNQRPLNEKVLIKTQQKADRFIKACDRYVVLFSYAGFAEEIKEKAAENDHILLFSMEDILGE